MPEDPVRGFKNADILVMFHEYPDKQAVTFIWTVFLGLNRNHGKSYSEKTAVAK